MRSALASPAAAVSLLALLLLTGMALWVAAHTGWTFAYPLDDSYIHLAFARTLATTGVWGIGPSNFSSASSSPGWTVLLAAFDLVFGSHLLNGLLLNALCLVLLCFVMDWGFRRLRPASTWRFRFLATLLVVLLGPLTSLAFIGMEHVAQTLADLAVCLLAVLLLAVPPAEPLSRPRLGALLACIAAAGALRYEAVFLVSPITLALLLRRRLVAALLFAACAALGPLAFGLYFHAHSGFFLPYSVIVKAGIEDPSSHNPFVRLWQLSAGGTFRPILVAPVLAWLLARSRRSAWDPRQLLLLFSSLVTLQHLLLAPTRWLMRYDTYFVVLALFALAAALPQGGWAALRARLTSAARGTHALATVLALVLLALSPFLAYRLAVGIFRPPLAAVDRYDEHVTMGRFVHQFYDHDTVVLNDIGAVAFYSHAHILDVLGLGSPEPVRALRAGKPITPEQIAAWAQSQDAPVALIQNDWQLAARTVPATWTLVQTWQTPRRVAVGPIHIAFYATSPATIPRLCAALQQFRRPGDDTVIQDAHLCPQP